MTLSKTFLFQVERSREFLAQVCEVPGQVLLEQPFTATCLLKNIRCVILGTSFALYRGCRELRVVCIHIANQICY